jgi:hypothetical protein
MLQERGEMHKTGISDIAMLLATSRLVRLFVLAPKNGG